MNNYCMHLKSKKGQPYCSKNKAYIQLKDCYKTCKPVYEETNYKPIENKSYKLSAMSYKKALKKPKKKREIVTDETYNYVIERDKYKCRLCESKLYLELHHINGRGPGKTNDVNNCIMLCDNCHDNVVHKKNKYWSKKLKKYI